MLGKQGELELEDDEELEGIRSCKYTCRLLRART